MTKNIKVSISELCYYMFFCILFLAKGIGLYDGQTIFKICLVLAACFVLVKIFMTGYHVAEIAVIAALLVLGVVIYKNSGEKSALIFLTMMIAFKNISFDRIMKVSLWIWGAAFGGMALISMLGMGNDIVMAHHKFGIDILRRGMGYSHPNVLHVSYAILVVLILFAVSKGENKIRAYLWVFAGNVIVFLYSASYTGFMLVIFLILFNIYFSYRKNFGVAEKVLIQSIFPICVLFSLFAPLMVEPDTFLFRIFNKALNQRFYASRLYMQENPLTLFGSRIYASHAYALDNSYVTLLIYGGLILFVLVCGGYIYTIHMCMKKQDGKALSVLLSFAIAGVIEPFLFNLSFKNLSLLLVAASIFAISKGKKEIPLLSGRDREIIIKRSAFLQRLKRPADLAAVRKSMVIAVIIGVLAGGCYYVAVKMPSTIYVHEKYCDISGEVMTIDPLAYEGNVDVVIYGCKEEPGNVYQFGSQTVRFEKFRDAVRLTFVVILAGYAGLPYLFAGKKGNVVEDKLYD